MIDIYRGPHSYFNHSYTAAVAVVDVRNTLLRLETHSFGGGMNEVSVECNQSTATTSDD